MMKKMIELLTVLGQILLLVIIFEIGKLLNHWLGIAIPGSIIGMGILLLLFYTKVIHPVWIATGARLLITHMPLLFLPVMAGLLQYLNLFAGPGAWLIVIALLSTWMVLISGSYFAQILEKRKGESTSMSPTKSQEQ